MTPGDAADDMFDAEMQLRAKRHALERACPLHFTGNCNWYRNDAGLLQCRTCNAEVDE